MTNSYYSHSGNCAESGPTLATIDASDFSKYWVHSYIDAEVLRGKNLKQQKLNSHQNVCRYDVIDIEFDEPSCSTNRFQNTKRCVPFGSEQVLYPRHSISRHKKNKRHNKVIGNSKWKSKCSMRIAELAVPTKRHCIDTWRKNQAILPTFMVERLRQIIMDEKPILKIKDAVNCFKKRKPLTKSRSEKKNPKGRNKNLKEIRLLCGIFGYKLTQKLLRPLNVILNTQLQAISQVVYEEIIHILPERLHTTKGVNNCIQSEIADKVTVWLTNILEDASNKLLLEDFQELEREEGLVWEIIDDLVDSVLIISKTESLSTLSKSVLDTPSDSKVSTLNDKEILSETTSKTLFDSKISSLHNDSYAADESEKHDFSIKIEENEQSKMVQSIIMSTLENVDPYALITSIIVSIIDNMDIDANKYRSEVHENDELIDIGTEQIVEINTEGLENIANTNDLNLNNPNLNLVKETLRNESDTYASPELKEANNDLINDTEKTFESLFVSNYIPFSHNIDTNAIIDTDNNENKVYSVDIDSEKGLKDANTEQTIIEEHVSITLPSDIIRGDNITSEQSGNENIENIVKEEVVELSNEDVFTATIDETVTDSDANNATQLEPSDSIKKVKFSNINIDVDGDELELNDKSNTPPPPISTSQIQSDTSKLSKDLSVKSDIYFAPPNDHLLSDADELWPKDLPLNAVKLTVSVSKSVMTLGNIIETEGKFTISSPEEKDVLDGIHIKPVINIEALDNVNQLLHTNGNIDDIDHVELLGSELSMRTENKIEEVYNIKNIPASCSQLPSNIVEETPIISPKEISKNKTFLLEMTIIHLPIINISPFIHNRLTHEKFVQTDKRKVESHGKVHTTAEYEMNKTEVHKWCKGLENVVNNLQIWSTWVQNTCTHIMFLKLKEYRCRPIRPSAQKWICLKTDINKDSALWFKLHSDLKTGLRSYKIHYENYWVRMTILTITPGAAV